MFPSPFPPHVGFASLSLDTGPEFDEADEALLPPKVSEKRRAQFLLGRTAARRALEQVSPPPIEPIRKGPDGEPVWPPGYIGSLTHSGPWAVAAVTTKEHARSVGIDLEQIRTKLKSDISPKVCTIKERGELDKLPKKQRPAQLTAIFSAKESIYKALYPICKTFFGFQAVDLSWSEPGGPMEAILLWDLATTLHAGDRFTIGVVQTEDYVLTSVLVPIFPVSSWPTFGL